MAKNKKQKFFKRSHYPESGKERVERRFFLPEGSKKHITGVVMIVLAVIVTLSFFEKSGPAGRLIKAGLLFLVGNTVFAFPLILFLSGLIFFKTAYKKFFYSLLLATFILLVGISGILETLNPGERSGGWVGYLVTFPLLRAFDVLVTRIIFLAVIIVGCLIFWYLLKPSFAKKEKEPVLKQGPPAEALPEPEQALPKEGFIKKFFAPRFKIKEISPGSVPSLSETLKEEKPAPELKTKPLVAQFTYKKPPTNLLDPSRGSASPGDIKINAAIIKKTLQNFDILVEMAEINVGPTVTQYTLKPAEGVKLSKITALNNDLALALAAHPIRIEAPVPGKSLVGIEVPNKGRAQVRLRELIESPLFQNASPLTFVLGKDVSGNPTFADLAKMPHLLVAGSTGAGKTVYLNNLILSLLYKNSPEILRFILIDPKRVEFVIYNELPHLLSPVIADANRAVNSLKWLINEMERRFDVLSESRTRDIAGYNSKMAGKEEIMPYIVLIIDELADLMAAKGREIEAGIVRLAQMARAVGIHLVVATQRPSVEVITGLIKANITSRITFQVASQVDSRTVLDMAGAEKLLGSGDLLYLSSELGKPRRIQSAFVSEKEVKKVVNWIEDKVEEKEPKIEIEKELAQGLEGMGLLANGRNGEGMYGESDPLYEEAKRVVIEAKKASASLLQRRLRLGYARAARLVDLLEQRGVVGPGEGAKPREVYFENNQSSLREPQFKQEEGEDEDEQGWQKV